MKMKVTMNGLLYEFDSTSIHPLLLSELRQDLAVATSKYIGSPMSQVMVASIQNDVNMLAASYRERQPELRHFTHDITFFLKKLGVKI